MLRTKITTTSVLVMCVFGLTACGSNGVKKSHNNASEVCAQLLGAEGVKWVKSNSDKETGLSETLDMDSARKHFFGAARKWNPESKEVPNFRGSEVCNIGILHAKSNEKYLSLRYGPSLFPFDDVYNEKETVTGGSVKVVPVNSDVKLAIRQERHGEVEYAVYVKCRVPKAPAGQESEVPLEGRMTDRLTGVTSVRVHLKYLLHSAHVTAKEFGCHNEPKVPMELPA